MHFLLEIFRIISSCILLLLRLGVLIFDGLQSIRIGEECSQFALEMLHFSRIIIDVVLDGDAIEIVELLHHF